MDFELSRCIERTAAFEVELTKAHGALEQINRIVRHQINEPVDVGKKNFIHPYTCGNNSNHTRLFPYWTGKEVVLKCPDCDYVQSLAQKLQRNKDDDMIEDNSETGC